VAILPIDALGFRRGAGAMKSLLQDQGLADMPLFAQAKARGIKALAGHAESVDMTNDVNGGPSESASPQRRVKRLSGMSQGRRWTRRRSSPSKASSR
jgi:hypothetical protein